MSMWSYILGTIEINMSENENDTQEKLDKRAQEVVDNLPPITGSERDMYVYLNRNEGTNVITGDDVEYQTNYVLTLKGNLRDRDMVENTCNEFVRFFNYLSTHKNICWIGDAVITISDGWHKKIVYSLYKDNTNFVDDDYKWNIWKVGMD